MITEFSGEYRFLSNFYPCHIILGSKILPTVEHAYQAMKTLTIKDQLWIEGSNTPGQAKYRGRNILIRPDWDVVKLDVMNALIMQKFTNKQNAHLKEMLIATGDEQIIEGNTWGDTFWGVSNGVGENHLGEILMWTREFVRSR